VYVKGKKNISKILRDCSFKLGGNPGGAGREGHLGGQILRLEEGEVHPGGHQGDAHLGWSRNYETS
jgi:hypothetical protein